MSGTHHVARRTELSFPYELRSFPARLVDGAAPPEAVAWNRAVSLGFHGQGATPADIAQFLACEQSDGRIVTGAYFTGPTPAGAWGAEVPVATYATIRKSLNIGAGTLLPTHLITAVTVRPSHRRRGLLRAMMEADLAQAKAAGLAMAALTASEATIYGRFGFGVATHACSVQVTTRHGLTFKDAAAGSHGVVEVAEASVLAGVHDALFARVHANRFGSIGRPDMYRLLASGQGSYASMEPVKGIRAALHYDAHGVLDGYVSYTTAEPELTIVDLLAASDDAYLALWHFLGSIDLIERVNWRHAPTVDVLEWALTAKRDYQRVRTEDHLWLRILDTPAALTARPYGRDGALALHVGDPLGHASGTFLLEVRDGTATVSRVADGDAELSLGVGELSSLFLGGVSARTLAAAGRVKELRPGAVARCAALFAAAEPAHCLTDF